MDCDLWDELGRMFDRVQPGLLGKVLDRWVGRCRWVGLLGKVVDMWLGRCRRRCRCRCWARCWTGGWAGVGAGGAAGAKLQLVGARG